jgi:DNA-binding GntR family transcriptional regulator
VTVPVPDLADPRAPYLQIADDLRHQINAGRYQPGDRLPSLPAMSAQYSSASETIRRALAKLRDEGLVATQSTRGTFVLRTPAEPQPSPEITRLETALQEAEARLTRHIDTEIARLREELQYTRAQVMALDERTGGALPQKKGKRG